jgi:hypothetical protein
MDENIKAAIEEMLKKHKNSSINVLNQEMAILANKYNNTGQSRFDGLSPEQMRGLLYGRWGRI